MLFAELTSGSILSGDSLGELGKPAEKVGAEAANDLLQQLRSDAPVDRHLSDQAVVFMALACGRSAIRATRLTLHTTTCVHVAQELTGARFVVEEHPSGSVSVLCEGIGLRNRFMG